MPQGVPTSEEKIAEFRASYLYSGNASESAKECGLNDRTARGIAAELLTDHEFSEARRKLRATALDELVAMRMRVARTALERFEEPPPEINAESGAVVTIIDKRADFGKLVLESEKNAHNLARFDAEKSGEIAPDREVVIRIGSTTPAENAATPTG